MKRFLLISLLVVINQCFSQTYKLINRKSISRIYDSATGNVGIGTVTPNYRLHVSGTSFTTGPSGIGNLATPGSTSLENFGTNYPTTFSVEQSYNETVGKGPTFALGTQLIPGSNSSREHWGMYSQISTTGAVNYSGEIIAAFGEFDHHGTGTCSYHYSGVDGEAFNSSSGNITGYIAGLQALAGNYGSGFVANSYGVNSRIVLGGTGEMTNAAGVFVDEPWVNNGTNTIINLFGLSIANQALGTNNFSIYTNQSVGTNNYTMYHEGEAKSYFAGNIGVGTISPATKLDVSGAVTYQTTDAPADPAIGSAVTWFDGTYFRIKKNVGGTVTSTIIF